MAQSCLILFPILLTDGMSDGILSFLVASSINRARNYLFNAKYNDKDPGKYEKLSLGGGYRPSHQTYEQEESGREGSGRAEHGRAEGEGRSRGVLHRFAEHLSEEMGNLGLSEGHRRSQREGHQDGQRDFRSGEYEHHDGSAHARGGSGATRIQLTRR